MRILPYFPLLFMFVATGSAVAESSLQVDPPVSSIGSYRIHWQPGAGQQGPEYELQESSSPGFTETRSVYRGPDRSTVMSGRGDGEYYYRLRELSAGTESAWGDPVVARVRHHPLSRAFAFFAAGALVFIATLALIVAGSMARRR